MAALGFILNLSHFVSVHRSAYRNREVKMKKDAGRLYNRPSGVTNSDIKSQQMATDHTLKSSIAVNHMKRRYNV